MNYFSLILEILFPLRCSACGAKTKNSWLLCDECLSDTSYLSSPLCTICGTPFSEGVGVDHVCEECLRSPPSYSFARSLVEYEGAVVTLLRNLKYKCDISVRRSLLKIAETCDFKEFEECDLIIPVPLHKSRLRSRGLNQALFLARIFFLKRAEDIDLRSLVRIKNTRSQTALDVRGRKRNVKNSFEVLSSEHIENKKICLVDDVFTTGSTVRECCRVLKKAGAKEVKVLTFARVRGGK